MRWLLGLPLLPLLICGAVCVVPAVLVALGLRRRDDAAPSQSASNETSELTPDSAEVKQQ